MDSFFVWLFFLFVELWPCGHRPTLLIYKKLNNYSNIDSRLTVMDFIEPKSLIRPTHWSKEVENAYRFQLAGYRDENEYKQLRKVAQIDMWPDSGFVKKLQRRKDGYFYYFDKDRECPDKEINKCKIYSY